jgi:hypothetical protein
MLREYTLIKRKAGPDDQKAPACDPDCACRLTIYWPLHKEFIIEALLRSIT